MSDKELIAEAGKHVPYAAIMDDAKWCMHCADEWPCVTRRLADALEAAEARVKELESKLAARQLSENDREVLAKQLRDIGAVRKVDQDCSCQDCEGAAEWVNAPLSVVLDHFKTNVSDAEPTHLVCAWCPQPARGDAWHNDGKLHPSCGQIDHGQGWVPPYTPRAAVPDAATERERRLEAHDHIEDGSSYLDCAKCAIDAARAERDDLEERLAGYLCDSTGGLLSKTGYDVRTMVAHTEEYYDKVHAEARKEAEAERDAALAAVEAIRKLHEPFEAAAGRTYCGECSGAAGSGNLRFWPCETIAALDGEPEPEETKWEYGLLNSQAPDGGKLQDGAHLVSDSREHILTQQRRGHPAIQAVRRRKAGPWLPVEGEKP